MKNLEQSEQQEKTIAQKFPKNKHLLVAVILTIVVVGGGGYYIFSLQKNQECEYGFLPRELYLDIYTVKQGDTLVSIANHELGSPARIGEIINLNKNRGLPYSSLYSSDVIQEGWELYLSAELLPPNTGDLVAMRGRLRVDNSSRFSGRLLVVSRPNDFPTGSPASGSPVSFASDARFFAAKSFQAGDCVMIIRDEGTDKDIVMAPQSTPYAFKEYAVVYKKDEVTFPRRQAQCAYDFLGSEELLRTYTVQTGDTLYSIAKKQLGDGSRASELRKANEKRYANLKNNIFIEIGWELLLPPSWTISNDGAFSAFLGVLVSEDEDAFRVASDLSSPSVLNFKKNLEVRYFDKESFERGDCVIIFNTKGRALGIASQHEDYIYHFKYSE